ncbi:MAG: hypothetical protein EA384_15930 [Spirochaetaceae bacterium]|nr:MAG: hypothetical protein EA384_15930 [Spirochaetaceae bacterium]
MSLSEEFQGRGIDAVMIRIVARTGTGMVKSLVRAILCRAARLEQQPDLQEYNPVIVCSPIWAGHLTPEFLGFVKGLRAVEGKQFYSLHCCFGDTAGALGRASELLQQKGVEVLGTGYITTSDLLERAKLPVFVKGVVDVCIDRSDQVT